ncbi:TetR/AcrR family transcriptional regulator [Leifsonia aquatica]|uniref:TetR/AcrR family transcriptional regulator n=1 Tax=Leifsonia aquatica TaxID=144185 RepID=UPI0004A7E994|nr:TetR/AcrR family transcriptional regulator [Leifsonia aquatica]
MRADALRNRERIFDAARDQMRKNGAEAGMDQIAVAAGVAVGTLYRHFPTKGDLVRAVMTEFIQELVDRGESAAASVAPAEAFGLIVETLRSFIEGAAENQALKQAGNTFEGPYVADELIDRGRVAMRILVTAAIEAGDLRPDVTADDIFLLMTTAPTSAADLQRERWLDIVTAGLRRA